MMKILKASLITIVFFFLLYILYLFYNITLEACQNMDFIDWLCFSFTLNMTTYQLVKMAAK